MNISQIKVALSEEQWKLIDEMIDSGIQYDSDGCDTSVAEEKSAHDREIMTAVRKLREQL